MMQTRRHDDMNSTRTLAKQQPWKFLHLLSCLICLLALGSGTLSAQSTYGSVVGAVTDNTGAVLPNLTVTLTNTGTEDRRTAVTNANGEYEFVNLPPGTYEADVESTGFKHFIRTNIPVQVQGSTRVDVTLQVGAATQTVEITSEAPLLETQNATVGQVVEGRAVNDMPLNGRNVLNLLELSPGITPQGQAAGSPVQNNPSTNGVGTPGWSNYQISGGLPGTGSEFIDGAPMNTGYINNIGLVPTQDSIQEFRVETNDIGPEYGATTNGIVTMATKSGSNVYHGALYEYLRNKVLNASTFFADRAHLPKPAYIQNQFGGTIGGPIKKDRLFYFGSYEGYRAVEGVTTTYTVPTANERQGIFSTSPITDPGTFGTGANATVFTPNPAGTYFPVNAAGNYYIPSTRFDPTAVLMLAYYAPPQTSAATNNFTAVAASGNHADQYVARLDDNLSDKQRLFARYTYWNGHSQTPLPYGYIQNNVVTNFTTNQFVLGDDVTLNPTTILDLRLSYTRFGYAAIWASVNHTNLASVTTWPGAQIAQMEDPALPRMTVSGLTASSGGGQWVIFTQEDYALSGSLTKIIGRHTVAFGGEFRRMPSDYGQTGSGNTEIFNFTTAYTGNGFASYLLGLPLTSTTENVIMPAGELHYAGAYLGDTFQMTNKLTITGGVRWEYPGYFTERHDRETVFLPNVTSPLAATTGLPLMGNVALVNSAAYPNRSNVLPHWDLVSPRVGLAYRPMSGLVIRSGFGITYTPGDIEQGLAPYSSPINTAITTVTATTTVPINSLSDPFPNGVQLPVGNSSNYQSVVQGQSISTPAPVEPAMYLETWNLDVQKDLGKQTLLDVAYVGSLGLHEPAPNGGGSDRNINQIPDQYLSQGSALAAPVTNPFKGLFVGGNLNGATIPAGQLLRPYPQYYALNNAAGAGFMSSYNGFQMKLDKRFNKGGTVLGSYAWAKNVGNSDTQIGYEELVTPGQVQDWTNLKAEHSLLSFNAAQRLTAGYIVDLPVGKGQLWLNNLSGVGDKVISGWGINGVSTWQSGFPIVLTAQGISAQALGTGTPRPNVVSGCQKSTGGSAYSKVGSALSWFNTSCFTQPGSYAFGNESRVDASIRAQGIANSDFALYKDTAIKEGLKVQFRAEVFNLFNRVQFGPPNSTCCTSANATFGVISSQSNNPRLVQFALRLAY